MLLETWLTTQSCALFLTRSQQDQPKSNAGHVQGAEIELKLLAAICINVNASLTKRFRNNTCKAYLAATYPPKE
jgi:hypothetical protein